MGCLGNPFQIISDKFVIGRACVLKRIREDHWGMGNWLFLVDFLLDLQNCLIVRFVVLNQKLDILFLWESSIDNPDQFPLDSFTDSHVFQTLNDFFLEPFIFIFMEILANLKSQKNEILFIRGN